MTEPDAFDEVRPAVRGGNPLARATRRLYQWVVSMAERRYAVWALFAVAVAESSFFPIPPDVLLIAMGVARSSRALWFASVTTCGSVLGAGIGYWIGHRAYDWIGRPIVRFYGLQESYIQVQEMYRQWDAVAVGIAGFTPIPFKVFTIAAGAFDLNLWTFFAACVISRGARFFLVGGLLLWFGPPIRAFIERWLNWLAVVFAVLLLGGFLLVRYAIK